MKYLIIPAWNSLVLMFVLLCCLWHFDTPLNIMNKDRLDKHGWNFYLKNFFTESLIQFN